MKTVKYKLSIVIATNKRKAQLERLLKSLAHQITKQVELIIIHNSYGLSKARNKGWKKANGQYVAFIDDDAIANPDWVEHILGFINKHPDVLAFGGPYRSLNQQDIPSWIPKELTTHNLSIKRARPLNIGFEWLTGTNMVYARHLLLSLGGFDENLGVKGGSRGYGEETELQIRIANAGHQIWHDPSIMVEHEFAGSKQNMLYLLLDQYRHGRDSIATFRNLRVATKKTTAKKVIDRIIAPALPIYTKIYYLLSPWIYTSGKIMGYIHEKT